MKKVIALDAMPNNNRDSYEIECFLEAVVNIVSKMLLIDGYDVILTQYSKANYTSVIERVDLARKYGSDILISIQVDSSYNTLVRGYWAFYWHESQDGKRLANRIINNAQLILPSPSRGVRASKPGEWTDSFMVRVPAKHQLPAVIIKFGFISNYFDNELLKKSEYHLQCSQVICNAVKEYFANKK